MRNIKILVSSQNLTSVGCPINLLKKLVPVFIDKKELINMD